MNKFDISDSLDIKFISYNPDYLRNFSMPISTREYLSDIGLPELAELPLGFNVIPIVDVQNNIIITKWKDVKIVFAKMVWDVKSKEEAYFYFDEVNGNIGLIDLIEPHIHFVNTSISTFIDSLLAYKRFSNAIENEKSEKEVNKRLKELRATLRSLDPSAMSKGMNYWPLMMSELAVCI